MKETGRTIAGIAAMIGILTLFGGPGTASATPHPVIYGKARAIPTRSGDHVRIMVFTRHLNSVRISVDNQRTRRASREGKGCGSRRCDKWKVYARRSTDDGCYELGVSTVSRPGLPGVTAAITVCESFPNGTV